MNFVRNHLHVGPVAGWWVLGGLAAVCGALLGWQWRISAGLRDEIAAARTEIAVGPRAGFERAGAGSAEAQAAELSALRADREALTRLRAEVEALKAGVREVQAESASVPPAAPPPARLELVPASAWQNAGRATPKAALETALWAAVGGDIDVLAATISLEGGARARAEAILADLPAAERARYASPEQLVALFTARDVPVGASMRLLPRAGSREGEAGITLVLQGETATRSLELTLRQRDGAWQLVVPESAVEKYGAMLKEAPALAAGAR